MARHETVFLPGGEWTEITNADVSSLRVQNLQGHVIELQATSGTTPPASADGAIMMNSAWILTADLTLAQLFPGVAGATRVWCRAPDNGKVSVSHA